MKINGTDMKIGVMAVVIVIILIIFFSFSGRKDNNMNNDNMIGSENNDNIISEGNASCVSEAERKLVRGTSLSGIVEEGQEVILLYGYYGCNEVLRGDLVAYDYKGNAAPVIKRVVAVPGDNWTFREDGGYLIILNGQVLTNSRGVNYTIAGGSEKRLALYAKDYPRIPKNTYMLMGEDPQGTLDSSVFGLIDKGDLFGKVIIPGNTK